jgi:rhodanese-related sulfurtransferase
MPARIDLAQVRELLDGGAPLLEVLPRADYTEEHLPGAVNIPLKELDATTAAQLDRSRPVVVYCWDGLCDMSPRAACRLQLLGFLEVDDYVAGNGSEGRPSPSAEPGHTLTRLAPGGTVRVGVPPGPALLRARHSSTKCGNRNIVQPNRSRRPATVSRH